MKGRNGNQPNCDAVARPARVNQVIFQRHDDGPRNVLLADELLDLRLLVVNAKLLQRLCALLVDGSFASLVRAMARRLECVHPNVLCLGDDHVFAFAANVLPLPLQQFCLRHPNNVPFDLDELAYVVGVRERRAEVRPGSRQIHEAHVAVDFYLIAGVEEPVPALGDRLLNGEQRPVPSFALLVHILRDIPKQDEIALLQVSQTETRNC